MAVVPKKNKKNGKVKRSLPKGFKGFKSVTTKDIDQLRKDAQARSGKEIRLSDKEAITVRYLEEPTQFHRFDEHFVQGDGGGYVPCIGNGCPLDGAADSRAARKWLANVVDVFTGEVRLIKMTRALVDTMILKYERSAGKSGTPSLKKRNYTITRLGSTAQDTKYDVENEDSGPLEIGGKEVNLKKLQLIDVDEELTERVKRFFGGGTSAKVRTGRGADDDEEEEDEFEDEEEEEDEDEEEDELDEELEEDDEDDEDEDEDEEEDERPVRRKPLPRARKKKKLARR